LTAVQTQLCDPNRLDVLLQWAVSGVIDANYGISLRLHDAAGKVWTSLDTQPGYGFHRLAHGSRARSMTPTHLIYRTICRVIKPMRST
jgi:hypothetical protein